ncbi:MAG: murein tripeptide amidase MpaA [Candidatus Marinimicrobia bacterium]|jgi:murein peptide amidase A|nr:murein tripeptide amidase MpaA [Candidatus Neomarinimicrobiota bacterium]MBT4360498.1 murein tripeptide amidase MpaA [Candidatus Neomarinimicrobiota bacterium]MBT4716251.1 murein tripeptide amidase MpaA [Candidatus Neomarinimicrobiota bacterium]MBT4945287.1 murein tripeptide amidase MpaA [Candidatus Neomarinimicrobiota bacterium]MBT5269201.1 murein tripeptide amidase MpaA [Candidatus Neomarinimicrobiota bacterium]
MSHSPSEFGPLTYISRGYGYSEKGLALEIYEPLSGSPKLLIMGSIHGDESFSTVLLSECLRSIQDQELKSSIILTANPDGVLAGTRCNSRGVDLNRNYPTANWSPDPVFYRNRPDTPQNIALSPGDGAASESETKALIKLIQDIRPKLIVSIHGFLGCIDDPDISPIAKDIALRSGLELVPDVGYATPGSFGSWCKEQAIPIITYELPAQDIAEMKRIHTPILKDLMTGHYHKMLL